MPSTLLNTFSVPLPNQSSASNQGLLMPKLQYRFRVQFVGIAGFYGDEAMELTKQVVSFTRPTVSFADVDLHVYNSTAKIAGKHTWSDVSTTIRDDANGNVTKVIGAQLQRQFDFFNQRSAAFASNYKFDVICEMLDGGNGGIAPTVLETWQLQGCYIKEANYQEMNYANSEAVTIQLTLRYDNAVQLGTGLGVGGFSITASAGIEASVSVSAQLVGQAGGGLL
jgi:hypothetical protein